jgi:hypothetical protein
MTFDEREFKKECMKEIEPQINQELWALGDAVLEESMNYLDNVNKTSDTGALAGSGFVQKNEGEVIVTFNSPYAADIEYGTNPHYVDPNDLKPWVRRKLKTPNADVAKVARIISNKILFAGTNPQPFLRPSLNKYVAEGKLKYEITGAGEFTKKR